MALAAQLDLEPTEHPHIVRSEGVCAGRPHIRGSRISVRTVAELFAAGESAEEIAATYPRLVPAAIYDAISYYLDHRREIEAEIAANELPSVLDRHGATLGEKGRLRFAKR
jgi:uncharacterized protein (DUF433 family)